MAQINPENAHDVRQPLNVIALVAANLRGKLANALAEPDASYLRAKLDRIENQLARALNLLDAMAESHPPPPRDIP